MHSPRRICSSVLLTAGMVSFLAGCASRAGWEFAGEEVQETRPTNIMTADQIAEYPTNWSIEQVMMQGIPGLLLTSASSGTSNLQGSQGQYGISDGPSQYISLRGISGGPALIIVDGVPRPDGETQIGLSPSDVERIEILKDAASTAMYGFRGGNGVILITTKTGERSRN